MKILGFEIKRASTKRVPIKDPRFGRINWNSGNVETVKDPYKNNIIVYSVIRYIIREIIKSQYVLYNLNGSKKEEITDHPLLDLLENPNEITGRSEFLEALMGYKFISGETFVYCPSPLNGVNKGLAKEMWVINPNIIKIKSDKFGVPQQYTMGYNDTDVIEAEPNQIIHLKYFNPHSVTGRGLSPLMTSALSIVQSQLAYKANVSMLDKGGLQGMFTYESSNELDDFDEEKQASLEDKWEKKNAEKGILITNAKLKWEQAGLKSVDLDLLNSIKFTIRDICNIYGISSQLMNDPDNKTYSNLKQARVEMISNIVIPELELFIGELNRTIVKAYGDMEGKTLMLGLNKDIYPELREANLQLVQSLAQSWWLTGNEKREALDYGVLDNPEMNEIYIPQGNTPIEIAGMNDNNI